MTSARAPRNTSAQPRDRYGVTSRCLGNDHDISAAGSWRDVTLPLRKKKTYPLQTCYEHNMLSLLHAVCLKVLVFFIYYLFSIKEQKCRCFNSPLDRNHPKNVRVYFRFVKFIRAVHSLYYKRKQEKQNTLRCATVSNLSCIKIWPSVALPFGLTEFGILIHTNHWPFPCGGRELMIRHCRYVASVLLL